MDRIIFELIDLAYTMILSDTPVDTHNLENNTTFKIIGNEAIITISAPKKDGSDYAPYVNYNRQRGAKEKKNYHYVERNLEQACNIIAKRYGGVVINEL